MNDAFANWLAEAKERAEESSPGRFESWREKAETLELQHAITSDLPRALEMIERYESAIQRLLNKVNKVTAYHRGGLPISSNDLDELNNRQIEVEEELDRIKQLVAGKGKK